MDYIENPRYGKSRKGNKGIFGVLKFSQIEIQHLFWAWLAISVAFANVINQGNYFEYLIISAIAVGLGFLLHELGHKYYSQKYGIPAEFRASYGMLVFAVITSFFGIVFAAPGAVMIYGRPSKKLNGIISAAGPIVNLVLAVIFGVLFFLLGTNDFISRLSLYGFMINSWLALFNLIPFAIFDGKKIYEWNKIIWGLLVGISLIFLFAQGMLFY